MWELNSGQPIYVQIVERIRMQIISGELKAGEKIHSVRDLALIAGVNPNTMQKALAQLENEGLIITQRTMGRFITTDTQLILSQKDSVAKVIISEFFKKMGDLGISQDEALNMLTINKESE